MKRKALKDRTYYLDLHDRRTQHWAVVGGIGLLLVLSLLARKSLLGFQNPDYQVFSAWYDFVKVNGVHSFKYSFSNYNPPYTYFLYISTILPVAKMTAIKGVIALFDFVLAGSVYYTVKAIRPSNYMPWLAAIVMLFVPTVLLTGGFWGQFDQLYTAFILFSVGAILRNNSRLAWLFFGIAISVKFQAVFFLPVLGIMAFKRIRWQEIWWGIGSFLVLTLLPVLAGRSLSSLLSIYPDQAKLFNGQLVLNAPNIYQWVPNSTFHYLNGMGIALALAVAALMLVVSVMYKRFSDSDVLLLTALSLLLIPFVLPAMHERYLFPASVATVLLAFARPRLTWVALVVQVTVLFSYCPFLFQTEPVSLSILAVFNLAAIYGLCADFLRPVLARPPSEPSVTS